MTTSSEHRGLQDLARTVFEQMDVRGTKADVLRHFLPSLTAEQRDYCATLGASTIVGSLFRRQGEDGLPLAPAVNRSGIHSQLLLTSPEEGQFVINSYLSRGRANYKQAVKYRTAFHDVHDVWLDLEWADDTAAAAGESETG